MNMNALPACMPICLRRASDPITDSWLWAPMWLVDIELRKLFTTASLQPSSCSYLKAHFPLHWCHNIIADLLCHFFPHCCYLVPNRSSSKEEEFILVLTQRVWTILAEKSWQLGWFPSELLLFYMILFNIFPMPLSWSSNSIPIILGFGLYMISWMFVFRVCWI